MPRTRRRHKRRLEAPRRTRREYYSPEYEAMDSDERQQVLDSDTKLELSLIENIKDDIDFCVKLAREENLVFLPGEALGLKNWMRITIGVGAHMLEDALSQCKLCIKHSRLT